MRKTIKLKVAEAIFDENEKPIARISTDSMKKLKIDPGDVIEINKKTAITVEKALPFDRRLYDNYVRINGRTRYNAKTTIGKTVEIKKVNVREAKKVTLSRKNSKNLEIKSISAVKKMILGKIITKGDYITLKGFNKETIKYPSALYDALGLDITAIRLNCQIISLNPEQAAIITENTEINLG